ncbi:MAG: protease modulator HflC [Alphaproteobacteria bacterium]|nr:protease modulator HflC [Alphaproteobacteria bacterium]
MQKKTRLYVGLLFIAFVVLSELLFIVPQTKQAIVIQFGEPKREIKEAGLHMKVPFIQKLIFYDNRLLSLDPPAKEVLLADKKRVVVDTLLRFKIVDPLKFYQALQNEEMAHSRLTDACISSLRDVLGTYDMKTLLSPKREEIMNGIKDEVDAKATAFGVDVIDLRIRRADLPLETSAAVYARMRSEREREAKEFRAQGQQMNQKIKAEADRDRVMLLAEAQKKSQIIKGEGDREATKIWAKAANIDRKFYSFYRSLEAYKNSMRKENTSMILDITKKGENNNFFKHMMDLPN